MRHRLAALALLAATAVVPVVAMAAPAHADPTLTRVYSRLPYSVCISFGQSGQQNDRWGTWWCSASQPQDPTYPTYDLWAYVY
ncbi:hypothetical protein ABZ897_15075 [Nonomuraea sp. NPDC046802]|uniref:hypothetical protein n=1 Tax=Nonomuraea sp. NPDC046802 TaxID=3154919 RepID=UPI0033F448A6